MAFCKVVAVLVLLHNIGGLLGSEVESSIVGGRDAEKGRWPGMVNINLMNDDKTKTWRCGGTIISKQWVLTAASCFDEYLRGEVSIRRSYVVVGAHELKKKAIRYRGITNVIKHSDYRAKGLGFVNDLALVRLDKELKASEGEPVRLPDANSDFRGSSDCWFTGWGDVRKGVRLPDPETLQELNIPITPDDVCKAAYPGVTSDVLCAGDGAGGKDACDGDNGGPLMCKAGGGYVQVGIMSYGSCSSSNKPSVFTKVSNYLSFIQDRMASAEC